MAITFDDGAAYERYMGVWSQFAGRDFLRWLSPQPGQRWLDVGCGNGAFTQLIVDRCAPAFVAGVDPAEGALNYARGRFKPGSAPVNPEFKAGNAMELPYADRAFDIAVMPLVIFFVPDPARGVAEMARVVRAGGTVAAYGWDILGGGFPYEALQAEMRALDFNISMPPSPGAAGIAELKTLWAGAGLREIETHELRVQRTFESFDDYWSTVLGGPSVRATLKEVPADKVEELKARMAQRLAAGNGSRIDCHARANAVRGRVA